MRPFRKRAYDHDVGLGDACEAVLHGSYVEYLERRGEPVPGWAWLNLLAHGTPEELGQLIAWVNFPHRSAAVPVWRAAQSFLAVVVLDRAAAEDTGGLAELQRRFLVSLELALIAAPGGAATTPRQLVNRVLSILDDRSSRSR